MRWPSLWPLGHFVAGKITERLQRSRASAVTTHRRLWAAGGWVPLGVKGEGQEGRR